MSGSPQPIYLGHVFIVWLCLTILCHTCSPIHTREQGKTNCNWVARNIILKNNQGQILKLKQDFKCCNHRLNISDARDSAWLSNKADSKLISKLSHLYYECTDVQSGYCAVLSKHPQQFLYFTYYSNKEVTEADSTKIKRMHWAPMEGTETFQA